ncbi:ATP-binding protein [Clostridium sp.]|uniref:ATP-binding protein n=1 Tax=Clostridium sp. TaxID=1506 RepID=UPI002913A949|nr:ATP-binding protein [Clostridium sp.]MDU5107632.1 ATP-binding protein [Clostridium sp.]
MIKEEYEAIYKEQVIEEYKNNPLIEALPELKSTEQVISSLANYPYFHKKEVNLEKHIRIHIIQRIFNFFQPLPRHLELEQALARLIRQGYISKNPLKKEYIESLNEGYKEIKYGERANYRFNATASSITLVGVSGIGKSTIVDKILNEYDQVLVHKKYKEKNICFKQVVYLKIDCPFDGSLKSLCLDFFKNVDELIGSNYFNKYFNSRLSANAMLPIIKQISININLGVLVVDEIQHLSTARSGGAEKMLNFFVTLINTVSVPVVLIGTPKALPLFQNEFRQARRSSGQGNFLWDRLSKNEEFTLLIEGLWDYQWLKYTKELTTNIIDTLYEESQGIIDIVIKLFFMAQVKAISTNKEYIDSKIIKKVSEENFKILKPMLSALKKGKVEEIATFEDIMPLNIDLFIEKEKKSIEFNKKVEELRKVKNDIKIKKVEQIKEEVIIKLLELGYEELEFKDYLYGVLSLNEVDVNKLVRIIIDLITGSDKKVKNSHKKIVLKENDIRFLGNKAKDRGTTVYKELKNIGYIKELDSFLQEAYDK